MTDEEKPYGAYYQPDHFWTGGKVIKELHKIASMSRKDIRSWLAKQALWQIHIPVPKEIHHPHYDVTKSNEQHQFDLLLINMMTLPTKMKSFITQASRKSQQLFTASLIIFLQLDYRPGTFFQS